MLLDCVQPCNIVLKSLTATICFVDESSENIQAKCKQM